MKKTIPAAALVVLGLFAHASAAGAQEGRPVQFYAGGGAILPTGQLSEDADPGFRLEGGAILDFGDSPFALRAGVAYDKLAHAHGHGAGDGGYTQFSGVADVIYRLPGLIARPYLLAGGGVFRLDQPEGLGPPEAESKFGFDLGGGIDFPVGGMTAFLEARWQSVSTGGEAARFVPVTVGLRF